MADAARQGLRQGHGLAFRRHEKRRRPLGRIVHGRSLPAAFHQGHAVVPSRRRRHGHGRRQDRLQYELGLGLGCAPSRPVRRRPSREKREISCKRRTPAPAQTRSVIPAEAGIHPGQLIGQVCRLGRMPAFAGKTMLGVNREPPSRRLGELNGGFP